MVHGTCTIVAHGCSTLVVVAIVAVGVNTCPAIQHSCVDHGPPQSHAHRLGLHHIVWRRQPMLAMWLHTLDPRNRGASDMPLCGMVVFGADLDVFS